MWQKKRKDEKTILTDKKLDYFCRGELAEWSIAAVLKTVEGNTSGGSNPSLSAGQNENEKRNENESPRLILFFV